MTNTPQTITPRGRTPQPPGKKRALTLIHLVVLHARMDGQEDFERGLPTLARRTSAPASVVVSQLGAAVRRSVPPLSRGSREMGGTRPRYLKGCVGSEVTVESRWRVGLEPLTIRHFASREVASAAREVAPSQRCYVYEVPDTVRKTATSRLTRGYRPIYWVLRIQISTESQKGVSYRVSVTEGGGSPVTTYTKHQMGTRREVTRAPCGELERR